MIGRLAFAVVAGVAAYGAAENTRSAVVRRRLLAAWCEHVEAGTARSGWWV